MNGNRYFLMMEDHTDTEIFYNDEEYNRFLLDYSKNNKNPKNKYAFGNLTVLINEKNIKAIKYTVYKKITKSYDLDKIDNFLTEQVEDQDNLKERFKSEVDGGKGKMHIGYMYKGQAKTLPIFYKKDRQYVDYESLRKLMLDKVLENTFLSKIWNNPKLNQTEYRKKIAAYLEKIQIEYGKYIINRMNDESGIKSAVSDFIKAWCTRDGEISQRYVRELGSIVKNIIDGKNDKKEESKEEQKPDIKGKHDEDPNKGGPKARRRTRRDDTENMDPLF